MLNKLWPFFIIISIIFSLFCGNIEELNQSIFDSTDNTIKIIISLLGTTCLWCGIMKIAYNTSVIDKLRKILNPFINILFPKYKNNKIIKSEISMNIIANFLGLGNAATPLGLKALKSMNDDSKNKKELTKSMMMLILLNTASIQLIPTTVFSIRKSLDSKNSTDILFPIWCATICAAVAGIISLKILTKNKK